MRTPSDKSPGDWLKEFIIFLRMLVVWRPVLSIKLTALIGLFIVAPLEGSLKYQINDSTLIWILVIITVWIFVDAIMEGFHYRKRP